MKKVLVVDDERQVRELLKSVLTAAGFEVEVAEDGTDALEKMHATRFQCVLTDLQMPRMDGRKLAEEIKRLYPQVPAILMTGRADLAEGVQVFQVIEKPIRKLSAVVDLIKLVTGEPMQ